MFWMVDNFEKDDKKRINKDTYFQFMLRIYKVVVPEFTIEHAKRAITKDWNHDSKNKGYLNENMFKEALFELAGI